MRISEEAVRQLMSDPSALLRPEEHLAAVLVNDRLELPPESAQAGPAAAAPAAFESGLALCDKMRWRDRRQAGGSRKCKDREQEVRVGLGCSPQPLPQPLPHSSVLAIVHSLLGSGQLIATRNVS